ncbi:MAG: CinA family protein [Rhizobiales bacterium]|nr:CinA family protein [Hyphomicrobiales bacterium]MBO6698047.1 CinA family protein [Hyphomicrobiales bacterium]MBO6735699.1 CinA family protein [Hyphomicrobiales bacterium]MBO6910493.1 CinA family protein [Hyphomicrobiales bacterium]MBO6957349.1 CinA family protein [Hyphomicrobiales bacterium]
MADLSLQASALLDTLKAAGLMVATAESCTGGMIAAALTDIAGSSAVVDRGFVTYSNDAKTEMLGVPPDLIATHGAVSELVARAMAEGALTRSNADIAVSVTGVAGPDGGSEDKPVGTVHFGCARKGRATVHSHKLFDGMSRSEVRQASVAHAFKLIEDTL